MNLTQDFWVLTQVMPHILYHSEEALLDTLEVRHRQKREPVTVTLALLLGLGGTAAGIHWDGRLDTREPTASSVTARYRHRSSSS